MSLPGGDLVRVRGIAGVSSLLLLLLAAAGCGRVRSGKSHGHHGAFFQAAAQSPSRRARATEPTQPADWRAPTATRSTPSTRVATPSFHTPRSNPPAQR